jgi:hypothetical protein
MIKQIAELARQLERMRGALETIDASEPVSLKVKRIIRAALALPDLVGMEKSE